MKFPFIRVSKSREEFIREARVPNRKEREFIELATRVPIHRFADQRSYLEAGCKRVWATFRACHIKASFIQNTPFDIVVEDKPEVTVLDNEAWKFLQNPNPLDSWEEMLYQWVFHMSLVGEAYWLKDEINLYGVPKHVYPLIPCYVKKLTDPKLGIRGYEYTVNGKVIKIAPEEMIYFRRPHPMRVLEGMGDIEPSEALYNKYINAGVYDEMFIERGASPSGIMALKEKDPDPSDWEEVKAMWRKEYEGKSNIGKTAFLTGEWEYHKLGLSQQEMQSVESSKLTVEQIFMNHGIPLSVAGVEKATSLATARQDEINFRKYELMPLMNLLIGKLNKEGELFRNFGKDYMLAYQMGGMINVQQVVEDYKPLFDVAGISPNELRERAGLPRVDNPYLDQYYMSAQYLPVEMAGLTSIPTDVPALPPANPVR